MQRMLCIITMMAMISTSVANAALVFDAGGSGGDVWGQVTRIGDGDHDPSGGTDGTWSLSLFGANAGFEVASWTIQMPNNLYAESGNVTGGSLTSINLGPHSGTSNPLQTNFTISGGTPLAAGNTSSATIDIKGKAANGDAINGNFPLDVGGRAVDITFANAQSVSGILDASGNFSVSEATAVPEPGSTALLCLGAGIAGWRRYRQRKKSEAIPESGIAIA